MPAAFRFFRIQKSWFYGGMNVEFTEQTPGSEAITRHKLTCRSVQEDFIQRDPATVPGSPKMVHFPLCQTCSLIRAIAMLQCCNRISLLQIYETVETINQLKINREFFLGFARDPPVRKLLQLEQSILIFYDIPGSKEPNNNGVIL